MWVIKESELVETKGYVLDGKRGIEPRLKASKAFVLPLDDFPMV